MKRKLESISIEEENDGLILRDFISYVEKKNDLTVSLSKYVNEWVVSSEMKNIVKKLLSPFLKKNYFKSHSDIYKVYLNLIKEMSPPIIKQKNICYTK